MGLITEKIEVTLCGSNIKYYEEKGYEIPRRKDTRCNMSVARGTQILVKVEDLPKSSDVKIEVQCDCEDCKNPIIKPLSFSNYNNSIIKYNGRYYCKRCVHILFGKEKELQTKLNNGKSFEQWCIENNRLDILARWDYELNDYLPSEILYSTNKQYYFKCSLGIHKSELKSIHNFTRGQEGSTDCNECHSLEFLYPQTLDIWGDKNDKTPNEYSSMSHEEVWWKCPDGKHEDYKRSIKDSNDANFRCPECVQERKESFLQEKVRLYLESLNNGSYTILHEHNCTIIPKNPKTKMNLPFDNEVKELKLICEVNGKQHYEITNYTILQAKYNNTTPEYELHMQQVRDRYKKFIAYKQGYSYIVIPYWADDEKETWKKMINI